MDFLKRTWAVIHLDRLRQNLRQIEAQLPPKTKVMGVVKADAYGHGDRYVAQELVDCGVDFLAVSNLEEALSLRRAGICCEILILGFTPVSHTKELFKNHIAQTVFSLEYAGELSRECVRQDFPGKVKVHIKLDTGMGRIGLLETETRSAAEEAAAICALPGLDAQGIFSHLSSADSLDADSAAYTRMQGERYQGLLARLSERGISFPCTHLQNSAGIAFWPELACDYARAGIVMYGVPPSGEPLPLSLEPVMELKTVISMVKEVGPGMSISYNRRYVSDRPMRIATVPIGYADGYPRLLSNRAEMLLKGRRVPVIGNICMDQLMLDVTGVDGVQMGDIVTVVGQDSSERIGFEELSELAGTIGYEMMCLIGRRVPRVYMKGEKTIAVVDYLQN